VTAVRRCIVRPCPELTTGSRCTRHEAEFQVKRRAKVKAGQLTGSRGSTAEWLRLRKLVLRRDRHTCQSCGHVASDMPLTKSDRLEVHHIDGNAHNDRLDNLITLCSTCHRKTYRR
jgi:5-methylcytosine-specific restriction endonuclease McrA